MRMARLTKRSFYPDAMDGAFAALSGVFRLDGVGKDAKERPHDDWPGLFPRPCRPAEALWMHTNPAFRQMPEAESLAFVRNRGFGTLMMSGEPLPLVSHVPFLLAKDGRSADLHLTRPNPIARAVAAEVPAMIAVAGPDGYISPDWYGLDGQVPTWNYVAIHLVGHLERRPDAEMLPLLDRLSDHFEARLAPKPVWKTAKLDPEALSRLLRMIVPFRFHVTEVRSTWKLGQNKPDDARLAAAEAMAETGFGQEIGELAALMRAAR